MATAKSAFDPRSAAPTLLHLEGVVEGVPDRDLSDNDLATIAFARRAREDRPDYPHDLPDAAIAALRDELLATGRYSLKED